MKISNDKPILGIEPSASIRRHLREVMLTALTVEDIESVVQWEKIDREWDSLLKEILEDDKKN